MELNKLYQQRFSAEETILKNKLWQIVIKDKLQKYVPENGAVLDIAAGHCEFLNNIVCSKKIANDLNPDVANYANSDVKIIHNNAMKLDSIQDQSVDMVFASNFFEHLNSKEELFKVLDEAHRVLKPGGKFMVIQPNIKYAYKEYWDFIDHKLALTDLSLGEAMTYHGFRVAKCIPKIFPFSTKQRAPRWPILLRIYLRFPPFWWVFGRQMFMLAEKS